MNGLMFLVGVFVGAWLGGRWMYNRRLKKFSTSDLEWVHSIIGKEISRRGNR